MYGICIVLCYWLNIIFQTWQCLQIIVVFRDKSYVNDPSYTAKRNYTVNHVDMVIDNSIRYQSIKFPRKVPSKVPNFYYFTSYGTVKLNRGLLW